MDQDHLTKDQFIRLHRTLFPSANLLHRLERRMSRLAFAVDDPLYVLVARAQSAIEQLYVHVHYLSCSSGVGIVPHSEGDQSGTRAGN
jgi:hypothetical protein